MFQEEKTVVLRKPVEFNKATHAEVNLREATAEEMSKATDHGAGNNTRFMISLISQVSGLPLKVVGMLGQRDFQECNDFLGTFTMTGLETGETLSPD